MSNQIVGPPNKNYNFGLDFNYAVWTPGTVLDLVNVPWNNDYRDIVRFENRTKLDEYITSLESTGTRIEKMSYVKPNIPVRINIPINRAIGFNYLRASNPIQPIPGNDTPKNYYYFITDIRYLSPNATELVLQLDVWQTFGYETKFGTCYIERGHIGIANSKQFDSFGRDYLTIPEGFDLGTDYRIIAKRSEDVMGRGQDVVAADNQVFDTLVISTTDLSAPTGTIDDPILVSSSVSTIDHVPSGATAYVFEGSSSFAVFMDNMKLYPWVTQGIIYIGVIPKMTRYEADFDYGTTGVPKQLNNWQSVPKLKNMFTNWRNSSEILNYIPERYRHLRKFFTHPYMSIEMTTWSATPISLKPEAWADANAQIMERFTMALPNQRIQFYPRKYNSSGQTPLDYLDLTHAELIAAVDYIIDQWGGDPEEILGMSREEFIAQYTEIGDDFGDYLDILTQINNLPQGTIVNNAGIAYLAANAHSIDYQRESASWTQQRALQSAQVSYDQASKGLETARALTDISITADIAQTGNINRSQVGQAAVSAGASLIGGGLGGALAGGPAGAAAGAVGAGIGAAANMINAGIQVSANDEALAIRNAQMSQNLAANQSQGGYIRDTNKTLADWAAKGDYANSILGINAKVQDAALIQPTVSGQYGGDAANHAHATAEISIRWKLVDNAAIRRIGEYWLRYGYAVNQPVTELPDDMMCMTKFTYWKLSETYLLSSPMLESFKQAIRGIFEKGVTVWRNPIDIGNIDFADNQPLEGITL